MRRKLNIYTILKNNIYISILQRLKKSQDGLRNQAFQDLVSNHSGSLVSFYLGNLRKLDLIYVKNLGHSNKSKWFIDTKGIELLDIYNSKKEIDRRINNIVV